jgi:hypothetical protein
MNYATTSGRYNYICVIYYPEGRTMLSNHVANCWKKLSCYLFLASKNWNCDIWWWSNTSIARSRKASKLILSIEKFEASEENYAVLEAEFLRQAQTVKVKDHFNVVAILITRIYVTCVTFREQVIK